jgi:sterol desaturase/sphingolipid hydroxylase (fatty acid hydroxylase superfamily)
VTILIAAVAGCFTWTFLEYLIHRYMGHDRRYRRTMFGKEHIRHHIEGDYFAPTEKKLAVAAVFAAVLALPAIALFGVGLGAAWVAGLVGSYGLYEIVHRRIHTHAGIGRYGRWLRRHHFRHHLVDGRSNHGVTTPLWDLVFGSYRVAQRIVVPPRLCMVWLLDPATGAVRPEHAATYALGPARSR